MRNTGCFVPRSDEGTLLCPSTKNNAPQSRGIIDSIYLTETGLSIPVNTIQIFECGFQAFHKSFFALP